MFFEFCMYMGVFLLAICVIFPVLGLIFTEDFVYLIIRWFEWLGRREYDKTLTFEEYLSWFEIEE